MYPLNLLIKPASKKCNFKCKYCFYEDISKNRNISSYGFMELKTLETIIKKALNFSINKLDIAFQGGEPTLVGLDFYKNLIKYVKKYNEKNLEINYSIQTNGYFLNEQWAKFFAENNFLVGISLDGIKKTNDCNRIIEGELSSFEIIMGKIEILKKYNVDFNILTVITSQVAKNIKEIYNFYKENDFKYQQYIPCLDMIGDINGAKKYSLTPKLYGDFLCEIFDIWYEDILNGKYVYNRYFENIIAILKGYNPEACGMLGHCTLQNVIEADASVYPCDFYVLDKYKIGNLLEDEFIIIEQNRKNINFIEDSFKIEKKCLACKWKNLCRGGCRRYRENFLEGSIKQNYFCNSYKKFFEYSFDRLLNLAKIKIELD